jgi:hypothetical protein
VEWNKVEGLINFLEPFYDATLLLSKSHYPSIYYVIPIIDVISDRTTIESSQESSDESLKKCSLDIHAKLMEYIPFLRTDFANFAVILDSRLKKEYFVKHDNQEPLK